MQAWCCDPASRADRAEKLFGWAGVISGYVKGRETVRGEDEGVGVKNHIDSDLV